MKVLYGHKMIKNEKEKVDIRLSEYKEKDIAEEVLKILKNNEAFSQSRTFGDKNLGDPIEYEKLIIIDETGEKVFEYFNKAIHYLMQKGEDARQIFQTFTFFMG